MILQTAATILNSIAQIYDNVELHFHRKSPGGADSLIIYLKEGKASKEAKLQQMTVKQPQQLVLVNEPSPAEPKAITLNADEINDLNIWRQMAVRFFRKGKPLPIEFECKALADNIAEYIRDRLAMATSENEIKDAFTIELAVKPRQSSM